MTGCQYMKKAKILIYFLLCFQVSAQTKADLKMLAEIKNIKAIDNHSHVERTTIDNEIDDEGDAIGCGGLEYNSPPPMRLRVDNPIYTGAWFDLFGFRADSINEESSREYLSVKTKLRREKGEEYPAWILDKLNIELMLANRVAMGRGLNSSRFRWVAYGDPLLLPFGTKAARQVNSDFRYFYSQEEKLFKRYLSELKLTKLPPNFEQYLKTIVTPTLERQKANGAVAVKFVAAYYRSLDFADISKTEAQNIYLKYARRGEPTAAEYKKFQDYLFRLIAEEAARLDLVVHFHTGGGCGHFFNLKTANPLLLEPFINDPARKAKIVLIHGGYPFTNETAFLLEKPNVYADFSAQTFLLSPFALSRVLKSWLEYEPEKILFGTDASPATPEVGWEESAWLTNKTAREALAIALTEMVNEGEITRTRASELANMVLRENAKRLYGFDLKD